MRQIRQAQSMLVQNLCRYKELHRHQAKLFFPSKDLVFPTNAYAKLCADLFKHYSHSYNEVQWAIQVRGCDIQRCR